MTRREARLILAALGLIALTQARASAQGYTFQTVPMPASGAPWQVRDNLQFVGGNYLYTPGYGYSTYNYPGAARTNLVGLNANGYILGLAYPTANSAIGTPFLIYGYSVLAAYSTPGNGPYGTLTNGMLTASYSDTTAGSTGYIANVQSGAYGAFAIPSYYWWMGTTTGINDDNQVVGEYGDQTGTLINYIRNTDGSLTTFSSAILGSQGYIHSTSIAKGPLVAGIFSNNALGYNGVFVRKPDGSITTFMVPGLRVGSPLITSTGVVIGGALSQDGTTSYIFAAYPPGYTGPKVF